MTDTPRQEVDLTLDGKTYSIRPNFKTLVAIEAAANQPARTLGIKALVVSVPLGQRNGAEEISIAELATVIFCMVRGEKGAPDSAEAVGELLVENGYRDLLEPVGLFLVRAQKGNKEYVKEAIEVAKKAAEEAEKQGGAQDTPPDPPNA